MAASRRGQPPLSVHLPKPTSTPAALPDLPPISALFLIEFDVKAGYTIKWKQAVPGLELEGVVEYKSLPSGLHTVTDDLIYFVHDGGHAGLSAFINARTDDEGARNARMIAVGILVPLSYGRLGRAWRHAEALKGMAEKLCTDREQVNVLEKYWNSHAAQGTTAPQPLRETPLASPVVGFKHAPARPGHGRNRSQSDGAALVHGGQRLSPYHPAWSLTRLLETFGPLIFPLHRAALLRKRILISTHAPVREACDFVYDISVISNIPLSVNDLLDPSAPTQRLKPLFTVGVHDIPTLANHSKARPQSRLNEEAVVIEDTGLGWIACTTDSILAQKGDLWDMLVTMPPVYSGNAKEKVWPVIESPQGVLVRATQRDMRRFRHLQASLARFAARTGPPSSPIATKGATQQSTNLSSSPSEIRLGSGTGTAAGAYKSLTEMTDYESEKVVEPTTWAALAYSGFMWWASAGDMRGEGAEETSLDASLLPDLAQPTMTPGVTPGLGLGDSIASLSQSVEEEEEDDSKARIELAIIAYFHRLTTQMLAVLADLVESSDDEQQLDTDAENDDRRLLSQDSDGDQESRNGPWIRVDSETLEHMGLDVWSSSDATFVRELMPRYFARRAYVEGKGVEVCGLRVC